jgi:hypothetical protein
MSRDDEQTKQAGMTRKQTGAVGLRDPLPSSSYIIHDTIIRTGTRRRRRPGIRPRRKIP